MRIGDDMNVLYIFAFVKYYSYFWSVDYPG